MRTFHRNAPIIIGAGALVLLVLTLAPLPLKAEEQGAASVAAAIEPSAKGQAPTLTQLRARLDQSDRALAVRALEMALTELSDGATLVWRRPSKSLGGTVKPVAAFRDDAGRICRHVVYSLTLGAYEKTVEGTACRDADGRWSLG